jgi:hypothetical protein
MKWEKKGLVYFPNKKYEWNQSHAQVPVVDMISDKVWRIYYSARNKKSQSHISYIEVEAGKPERILYEHDSPILALGAPGNFDDSGIMPSCIINVGSLKYLYYIGWNAGTNVSYRLAIGLAISKDKGKTFSKYSAGPIMDRSVHDHCLVASPFILKEESLFKMWYISGTHWEIINGKPEPFYHVKYAYSNDGINWIREGTVCIDYDKFTHGISRPCVLKENGKYLMFYSFRNNFGYRENKENSYRIGYAFSEDGIQWIRADDKVGIYRSETGWDSEMIAYPYLLEYQGQKFMFYNGNGFGSSGIGYAILKNEK